MTHSTQPGHTTLPGYAARGRPWLLVRRYRAAGFHLRHVVRLADADEVVVPLFTDTTALRAFLAAYRERTGSEVFGVSVAPGRVAATLGRLAAFGATHACFDPIDFDDVHPYTVPAVRFAYETRAGDE